MQNAIDQYYKTFSSVPIKSKKLKKLELYNLYQKPKKDKGSQQTHFHVDEPNHILQADLLYLPTDPTTKHKYALVVVDPATGITDAEPLKQHSSEAVLQGFKNIFDRGILKIPKTQLQVDAGTEFKDHVAKYFKDKGIGVKVSKTGRSRQIAFAEARNKAIGKAVHQRQTAEQLLTNEVSKGHWSEDLPHFITAINEFVQKKNLDKPKKPLSNDPILTEENNLLLPIGTKVRVKLERPIESTGHRLHGYNFRASDILWDPDVEEIVNLVLAPNEPPLYQISGKTNLGVAYTRNQIQVVPLNEQPPPSSVIRGEPTQYIVQRILEKKKQGRKTLYRVQWKGFNDTTDTTFEPTSTFKTKQLKDMIIKFNEQHPV